MNICFVFFDSVFDFGVDLFGVGIEYYLVEGVIFGIDGDG